MTTAHDHTGFEPPHTSSPTDHLLVELQLYGHRPFQDEPDPRPLPEAQAVAGAVADIFDALIATLHDTRLEADLDDLLWSAVNLFHRAVSRIERKLDDNEQAQRRSQKEQDGSEIRSVELERLTAEGQTLIERRNSMEFFRDQAAEQFEHHTGSSWRPRAHAIAPAQWGPRAAGASPIASGFPIAIEAAVVAGSKQLRRSDMANIGSFKKSGSEFQGEIVTLSVQTKGVRIVPETNRANDNAPSHRVYVGRADYV
jgi:hypothetical protein